MKWYSNPITIGAAAGIFLIVFACMGHARADNNTWNTVANSITAANQGAELLGKVKRHMDADDRNRNAPVYTRNSDAGCFMKYMPNPRDCYYTKDGSMWCKVGG